MAICFVLSSVLVLSRIQGEGVIRTALEAMGGRAKVERIQQVIVDFVSHNYALEQSERPEGPWFTTYSQGKVTIDLDSANVDLKAKANGLLMGGETDTPAAWSPAKPMPGYWFLGISGPRTLELGPERVLLTALAAKDLTIDRPTTYHDIPHDSIRFTWGTIPVRVLINHFSHLPAAVETVQAGQGFWAIWGDVTERIVYGNWDIAQGGVMLPTLWEVDRNGIHQEDVSIIKTEVQYRTTPGFKASSLAKFDSPPIARRYLYPFKGVEIAPGVVQYQGAFNCAAIDQGDGVVMLEGVVSTEYMHAILADVAKRFPNKPIKAVVTTDDAWPHIGGLRYFAAHRIPIVAMPLNRPILDRLFNAAFRILPDELAKSAARPILRLVTDKTEIGKGPNRLVIRPMRGSVTERMLYADLPERKLLYAPDVIQRDGDHWYNVNLVREMLNVLARDGVSVDTAFAFHSEPISISVLKEAVRKAEQ